MYIKDSKLVSDYNLLDGVHYHMTSEELPAGKVDLKFNFTKTKEFGGKAELYVNGNKVAETELLQELLEVFCRRQAILRRVSHDIRLRGRIRVWLLIHIPISVALLFATVIHIVTTFIYW